MLQAVSRTTCTAQLRRQRRRRPSAGPNVPAGRPNASYSEAAPSPRRGRLVPGEDFPRFRACANAGHVCAKVRPELECCCGPLSFLAVTRAIAAQCQRQASKQACQPVPHRQVHCPPAAPTASPFPFLQKQFFSQKKKRQRVLKGTLGRCAGARHRFGPRIGAMRRRDASGVAARACSM